MHILPLAADSLARFAGCSFFTGCCRFLHKIFSAAPHRRSIYFRINRQRVMDSRWQTQVYSCKIFTCFQFRCTEFLVVWTGNHFGLCGGPCLRSVWRIHTPVACAGWQGIYSSHPVQSIFNTFAKCETLIREEQYLH